MAWIMASPTEQILEVLRRLRIGSPEIVAAVLADNGGTPIASVAAGEMEPAEMGRILAELAQAGRRASEQLMDKPMDFVQVQCPGGFVVASAVGSGALLCLQAVGEVKPAILFLELKRAVPELGELVRDLKGTDGSRK